LVDYYLSRIEKLNGRLNAVLTVAAENAYQKTKKNDSVLKNIGEKAFKEFPLLGVVVIHKDMFLTKEIRTTAASRVLEDYLPVYSATIVEKLEWAGAITLAKANQDAWAHGSSGENSDFGPTKNPWNENLVPGGSSSGSAASLAADFCFSFNRHRHLRLSQVTRQLLRCRWPKADLWGSFPLRSDCDGFVS